MHSAYIRLQIIPDEDKTPLFDLAELSIPANTLIKKVSKAIWLVYEPYHIERVAKANANAALIEMRTELHCRTMHRLIEEEAAKQNNMEGITRQAIPHLKEDADAEQIDDDWLINFFDKARIVSDKEMQSLWAQILAGEANKPGSFSRRTINHLDDIDKADAELFTKLCDFNWDFGEDVVPLIFNHRSNIYRENGITYNTLHHLESIGLIQFNVRGIRRIGLPKSVYVSYHSKSLRLEMPNDEENRLRLGQVLLTKMGQELAPICASKPVDGFFEYVQEQWKEYNPTPIPPTAK